MDEVEGEAVATNRYPFTLGAVEEVLVGTLGHHEETEEEVVETLAHLEERLEETEAEVMAPPLKSRSSGKSNVLIFLRCLTRLMEIVLVGKRMAIVWIPTRKLNESKINPPLK